MFRSSCFMLTLFIPEHCTQEIIARRLTQVISVFGSVMRGTFFSALRVLDITRFKSGYRIIMLEESGLTWITCAIPY